MQSAVNSRHSVSGHRTVAHVDQSGWVLKLPPCTAYRRGLAFKLAIYPVGVADAKLFMRGVRGRIAISQSELYEDLWNGYFGEYGGKRVSGSEPVQFVGPAGILEGLLDSPASAPQAAAVVCHPHPLFQGSMNNKVAYILARAFNDLGAVSLRFNFRGVGRSEGEYAEGNGETADALAALDWLAARHPGLPLWLAGFSFGAYVALRAQSQRPVHRLVTVAPAVERFDTALIELPRIPWLLVQGDADEVVSPQAVFAWAAGLPVPPQTAVLAGAGHFFHGRLNDLRETVVAAFADG
jgi:uncharacterized protein